MSARTPWRVLGIAASTDLQVIKRAYAAKLKAIDVEAEPQAFMELRDAYETVRRQMQWRDYEEAEQRRDSYDDAPLPLPKAAGHEDMPDVGSNSADPLVPPAEPDSDPLFDSQMRINAIVELINDQPGEFELTRKLRPLLNGIWYDPALSEITYAIRVENILAEIGLNGGEAGRTLIRLAGDYYNWPHQAGQIGLHWPIAAAAQLALDEWWFNGFATGEHVYAEARQHAEGLKLLRTRPVPQASIQEIPKHPTVMATLEYIRAYFPSVESRFYPEYIAEWETLYNSHNSQEFRGADGTHANSSSGGEGYKDGTEWGGSWYFPVLLIIFGLIPMVRFCTQN